MKRHLRTTTITLAVLLGMSASAFAQDLDRDTRAAREAREAREAHAHEMARPAAVPPVRDARYHYDHAYPPRGYAVAAVPVGSARIAFGGGNYYYHGGVWFAPLGARFVVTLPPVGIVVPVLPPAFATMWIGGAPYYYANGVYYAPSPTQGYVVVAPPPGAEPAPALQSVAPPVAQAAAVPEPIVYPRNGQSVAQAQADRQACDQWARAQPNGATDGQIWQRADEACLDARGYTVR